MKKVAPKNLRHPADLISAVVREPVFYSSQFEYDDFFGDGGTSAPPDCGGSRGVCSAYAHPPDARSSQTSASPILIVETDGTREYYHRDGLGSIVALSSDSGSVVDAFSYGPYAVYLGTVYLIMKINLRGNEIVNN
jgi:hypothetical protein